MPLEVASAEAAPRVVKANAAGPLGAPASFNFADLRQACDDHLSRVEEKSRRLIGDAAGEAERIRREAAEAGRRDGYRDGLKAAEADVAARVDRFAAERVAAQMETLLPAIRGIGDDLQAEQRRWVARWEVDAVRLAVAIAEKILRRSIAVDPTAADRSIGETLRLAAGAPELTVRLSPADHERLGGSVAGLAEAVGRLGDAEVLADPAVSPGGCLVETRHGRVDGRLETQLDRIASELTGVASTALAADGT